MMYYIYCLEKNGVPFYIGKTQNIKNRMLQHKATHGDITWFVLKEFNYWKSLFSNEESFWEYHYIWLFRSFGFPLINSQIKQTKLNPQQRRDAQRGIDITPSYNYHKNYEAGVLDSHKKFYDEINERHKNRYLPNN